MKDCMHLMALDDMKGHWKTKNGKGCLVISDLDGRVQLFANQSLLIDEPLCFEYIQQENHCRISESIILWMIMPKEECVILNIKGDKVEFFR